MAMEVFNMQQKPAKTQEEAMQKPYQFWSTQPVPKMGRFAISVYNQYKYVCKVTLPS